MLIKPCEMHSQGVLPQPPGWPGTSWTYNMSAWQTQVHIHGVRRVEKLIYSTNSCRVPTAFQALF